MTGMNTMDVFLIGGTIAFLVLMPTAITIWLVFKVRNTPET